MTPPGKSKILNKVRKLKTIFDEGRIPKLHNHEVNPQLPKDSRENYLYFTLPVSINFQRSSPKMWEAALATYEDPKTQYLFFPEEVTEKPRTKIEKDLFKHRLSLLHTKHAEIWIKLCQTFRKDYDNDPRILLQVNNYNVTSIVTTLRKTKKPDFPYLSGPKMSNYWLYILDQYTDIQLQNKDQISIIPDTHVRKASAVLGLTKEDSTPDQVAEAWHDLLYNTEIIPIQMHPILWNWSRAGFLPRV